MSKISELVGDPHYNKQKAEADTTLLINTFDKYSKQALANACCKYSSSNTSEIHKDMQDNCKEFSTKISKVLNKATKILKDNEDNKDLDVFKNSINLNTDEGDKIMKNVDHPSHYQTKSGIEVIDVIEAFELGFNLGNVIKYVLRCGKKDTDVQELEKAKWYLEREISNRKNK